MRSFRNPARETIRTFLDAQGKLGFSYASVGATAGVPPSGYILDHTRIKLGDGEAVFDRARSALRHWDQFRLGWVRIEPEDAPIEVGTLVAVVARKLGLWWSNACRIIYVIDDDGPVRRFGYAYGTLPDHAGTGEERFQVEWDTATGEVYYDILAFSRPQLWIMRIGYPYLRWSQKQFGRESSAVMKAIASGADGTGRPATAAPEDAKDDRRD
ncbi:DUF1990 family protein [Tundrisphaera sp. TA3]|uniref:DUF1990 family protein n=1 Tax=Tundrisphaera sp. TA3 TaxID=3435775 RepID=UPI003EBC864D